MSLEMGIIVRTSILWVCAAILAAALRKASASARHAVWTIAMFGSLVLPLASLLIPAVKIPLVREPSPVTIVGSASAQTERSPFVAPIDGFSFSRVLSVPEESTGSVVPSSAPDVRALRHWTYWLWVAGFLGVLLRLLNSMVGIRRLARISQPIEHEEWQSLLNLLKNELSIRHPIQLRLAGGLPPMTWGFRSHTILLPDAALQWSAERRRAVLLHELAHVKRRDGMSHLAAQIVCGIYWFNPLVWYASHRLQIERERACDDQVLILGTPAEAYAHHLLQIACGVRSGFSAAAVSMAHPSQLETRLLAILDSRARRKISSMTATTIFLVLAAISLPIAAIQITSVASLAIPAFGIPLGRPMPQAQTVLPSAAIPPVAANTLASIEGTVVDSVTGKPIADAVVVVCERTGRPCTVPGQGGGRGTNSPPATVFSGTTNKDGKFLIEGFSAGLYMVIAAREGFSSPYTNPSPLDRGLIVTLTAGSRTKGVHLELVGTTSVSGKIVDADGNPQASLRVRLLRLTYDREGAANLTALGGALGMIQTNDQGDYRIFGVMPGTYYVGAVPPSMDPTVITSYYPGVVSLEQAVPVVVQSGGEISGINFTLAPWKTFSVSFNIGGALPPEGTRSNYQLRPRSTVVQPPVLRATSLLPDANGVYTLRGVPPGSFEFIISFVGATPATRVAPQHFEFDVPNKDVDLGTLSFKPGIVISGHLTMAGGATLQPAAVSVMQVGALVGGMANTRVSDDGSFTLPEIAEGRYIVSSPVTESRGFYFSAAHYGGRDVLKEGLIVDGIDHGPLELVLDGPAGRVEGLMLDAQTEPIANAQVVLIPSADRRSNSHLFLDASTDQTGKFTITGVAPGDYSVLAWERSVGDAYKNAEFLKDYLARALRVTVMKGASSAVINLRPVPAR